MPSLPHTVPSGASWQVAGHRHEAVCPSAERTHVLPKLQVTLAQGSRDPVGGQVRGHASHQCCPYTTPCSLTARPPAEEANASLLTALSALQFALIAISRCI
jgi:hypothetical protein